MMRINKWISHNTNYSRREADALIKSGKVKIRHKIATLSEQVGNDDRIFIDGREIKPKKRDKYSVIVYNKPKGELVSKVDDRGRKVIFDTLDKKFAHFIPIGRLDYTSQGLLLLSDSKEIASILMQSKMERIYNIKLDSPISPKMIESAKEGLSLENARAGGHKYSKITQMDFAPFSLFEIIKEGKNYTKIKVGINEGKNRELRRFFAHFGANVLDLKRVRYGFVELNSLPSGKYRYLSRQDYNKLHRFLDPTQSQDKPKRRDNAYRDKRK